MPADLYEAATELGLPLYAIPEAFGGVAKTLSPVTSVLIAEELAWGDMALAAALLAPFRWHRQSPVGAPGSSNPAIPGLLRRKPPVATIAIDEPTLFDPLVLQTRATETSTGYTLNGTKNGVVLGAHSDLILVAAELNGRPRVFIVENSDAVRITDDPAMGLRAAQTVASPLTTCNARGCPAGDDDFDYQTFIDHGSLLNRGLAIGTARAVLDYVIPYCNEREAFGEPISNRQAVAFMISNLAIETDSMRLLTWRAASRAETGQNCTGSVPRADSLQRKSDGNRHQRRTTAGRPRLCQRTPRRALVPRPPLHRHPFRRSRITDRLWREHHVSGNPGKFNPIIHQARQVAREVFRPISRKYDRAEHAYLKELDMFASIMDGMNDGAADGGAGAGKLARSGGSRVPATPTAPT